MNPNNNLNSEVKIVEEKIANFSLDDKYLTVHGNFKAPSRETKLVWLFLAWHQITTETIVNSWKIYNKRTMQILQDDQRDYLQNAIRGKFLKSNLLLHR